MTRAKRWIRITECSNIPLREGRSVSAGGHDIAVFNLGDRFLAIENQCPHKGGPLSDGIVSGNAVVCPLHAWRADLETGAVLNSGSARSCLKTFATRIDAGVVMLELPLESGRAGEESRECVEQDGSHAWMKATAVADGCAAPAGND